MTCKGCCCSEKFRGDADSKPIAFQSPQKKCIQEAADDTPLENISDEELLKRLRELLRTKAKSRKEAFDLLGGNDDGRIDKDEFDGFLKADFGSQSLLDRAFKLLDEDGDGFISKGEFKQLVSDSGKSPKSTIKPQKPDKKEKLEEAETKKELNKFKAFIKKHFKNPMHAFEGLDLDGSKAIQFEEFKKLLNLRRYDGDIDKVFAELDKDKDGGITWDEFRSQIDTKGLVKEEMKKHFEKHHPKD